ncbi:LapA family protein [Pseudomonas sp. Bout1]|uniref:LapA family protein n=1 Tax=Pseudomonas sp. Bout1 TaxID=3048600 RepID=UPI002AB47197|nr:LapA family protein [Pseudomonas sp. Bout1]MDY7531901.1 LapA family protein [Pseudomonas sp. Bout1]MEB0185050.1 LapA family protein [Pseudomonas sp. Bout1]
MRGAKRVLLVLIILVIVLGVLTFVLENQQTATLSFLGWSTPQAPVSIFVTISLIVGMIIGPLVGAALRVGHRAGVKPVVLKN